MNENKTDLILSLDVDSSREAGETVKRFSGLIDFYKIGSVLFTAAGPKAVETVIKNGGKVFLDLKYHDIPNTVKNAVLNAAKLGVYSVSMHLAGGKEMLRECAALRRRPLLWGISVLTSLDEKNLKKAGFRHGVKKTAENFCKTGIECGIDGIVCSGRETKNLKKIAGERARIIVPGISFGTKKTDQKRTVSPGDARRAGADFIIVGRAVLRNENPAAAAKKIISDLVC